MTQPPQEPQEHAGASAYEPPATPNPDVQGPDGRASQDQGSDGREAAQPTYGMQPSGEQQGTPSYDNQPPWGAQPYGDQAPPAQPYGDQPYGDQPYGGQPYGAQPPSYGVGYGVQPYGYGGAGGGPVASGSEPGLDLPYYGIGLVEACTRAFRKYARFDGRASRSEYWWFQLGVVVLLLVAVIPLVLTTAAAASNPSGTTSIPVVFAVLLLALVYLALIVPSLAISVRRLHDTDQSGWLFLLNLIPSVGGIVVLVLMAMPSNPRGARFDVLTSSGSYPG